MQIAWQDCGQHLEFEVWSDRITVAIRARISQSSREKHDLSRGSNLLWEREGIRYSGPSLPLSQRPSPALRGYFYIFQLLLKNRQGERERESVSRNNESQQGSRFRGCVKRK